MMFNATLNNISVISWRSILLVEETGESHWSAGSLWQTLSHSVVSSYLQLQQNTNTKETKQNKNKTKQSKTKTKQSKAKQKKIKQNKTKQNKTKQNK